MNHMAIENVRLDLETGDGVSFTAEVDGVAHRFFVSRQTLGDLERTRLTNNHDMLASFERQSDKVRRAIVNTLKFGTSPRITFLKTAFFN